MRVEHPDTFRCDICGREVEHAESVTVPVLWKTEQNEGRPCEPYIACERLDLCEECLHSVLTHRSHRLHGEQHVQSDRA